MRSLPRANLKNANLIEARNLTPPQIKSACYWEKAFYKGNWDNKNYKWRSNYLDIWFHCTTHFITKITLMEGVEMPITTELGMDRIGCETVILVPEFELYPVNDAEAKE